MPTTGPASFKREIKEVGCGTMRVDGHVHVCAFSEKHGWTSDRLLRSPPFRFMRWRLGIGKLDEGRIEELLAASLDGTPELDAVVLLAFDAVHRADGALDRQRTHLYVKNDYVIELCRRHPKFRFGASVHPFRDDAVAELDRCVDAGAVLLKWLPIVQGFDPSDRRCLPFYDAMARHRLPLLSHTGGEKTLIRVDDRFADPQLLVPALERGVTVIAAHCGSRSTFFESDHVDRFIAMTHRYPNLYGDTAALSLPTRSHTFAKVMADPVARGRLVHGSDWPVIPIPPLAVGVPEMMELWAETNWLRRDVLIKQKLGLDADYWGRSATVLGLASGLTKSV